MAYVPFTAFFFKPSSRLTRALAALSLAGVLAASMAPAQAQSEASVALSALPVASVLGAASVGAGASAAVIAVPAALSVAGSVLVVKAVEVTAEGTVYLLERASDGARASVRVATQAAGVSLIGVGTAVTVSVVGAGVILSAAGTVLAFIPNELGRALLHSEVAAR